MFKCLTSLRLQVLQIYSGVSDQILGFTCSKQHMYMKIKKIILEHKTCYFIRKVFQRPPTSSRAHPNPAADGQPSKFQKGPSSLWDGAKWQRAGKSMDCTSVLPAGHFTSFHLRFPGVFANWREHKYPVSCPE